jgi:alpha-mannosidase
VAERWDIVAEGDASGVYVHYVDNLLVTREGQTVLEIFRDEQAVRQVDWYNGYDAATAACLTAPARGQYPRGFVPAIEGELPEEWGFLDLGPHLNATSQRRSGETAAELVRGVTYRLEAPFRFGSRLGQDHIRAAGQLVEAGSAGGRHYYELHLAVTADTDKDVDSTWQLAGPNGELRPLAVRVPGAQAGDLVDAAALAEADTPGPRRAFRLSFVSLPVAAAFPIHAVQLPEDERVRLFAASLRRRDDAPADADFRRTWLTREVSGAPIQRYLRNVRFGPHFVDLASEEPHERKLFELCVGGRLTAFDDLLQQRLAIFRRDGAKLKKDLVYFIGESHIDLEWLWPWRETVDVCRDTYGQALRFMDEYPDFRYSQSSAQTYLWMKEHHPDIYDNIRKRVRSGEWEIVGGSWTEPDFNMPVGESLARQILTGWRFFKREFGREINIGWAPDSFGYCHQFPQLLRSAGFDTFFTTKMLWNDTTTFPYHLFTWRAPDGSEVLGCTPPQGIGSRVRPERLKKLLDAMEQRHGVRMVIVPFGVGDHGGGPSREDIEKIRELQQTDLAPTVRMSTAAEFLRDIRKRGDLELPVLDDEMYLEYHRGTYTSQGKIKWFNRKGEVLLLSAERFAALAAAEGSSLPREDFAELWRRVLFHQCHDGLPGTSVPEVKKDIADDYDWILPTAEQHLARSLGTLARSIDTTGPGKPVAVFNPLPWERTAGVEMPWSDVAVLDADEKLIAAQRTQAGRLTFQVTVPALGYAVYHLVPKAERPAAADQSAELRVDGWRVRNEHLEFALDQASGHLTSVRMLPSGQEVLAAPGNLLELYTDRPDQWDAWNLGLSDRSVIDKLDTIKIVEQGPVRVVVRIERSFSRSRATQDIVLYAGRPWIEFHTKVDWREDHRLLRAAFPLKRWSREATYHVPYGTISRVADPQTDRERAMFEVPALFWADQGDAVAGAALLNDCKYGYSASRQWLRLSLLKAATWPDPEQDQGEHEFTYALYPHLGDWRQGGVMHAGYELNYPLYVQEATPHEGPRPARHSFLTVAMQPAGEAEQHGSAAGLVLTTVKPAEDGTGWILRLHEISGRQGTVWLSFDRPIAAARQVDLLERPTGEVRIEGRRVAFPIQPHRIESLRVSLQR